jgi:hypothetical protein
VSRRFTIVDRLTFGGNILETGTDSYRLAQTGHSKPPHPANRHALQPGQRGF